MGEPAGIGPDLAVNLAQQENAQHIVVIGSVDLLKQRAELLGQRLNIQPFNSKPTHNSWQQGDICVYPVDLNTAVTCGKLDARNSPYVLKTLDTAIELCTSGQCAAMVTGPLHKAVINDAGVAFTGHTEYLAEKTSAYPVMMLLCDKFRVALATTHLPLYEVSKAITRELLEKVITILHHDLVHKFAIPEPRILVCGLNPHAGEDGHLGMEEINTIIPAVRHFQALGMNISDPLPADTLFTPRHLDTADAVLSMFHDQGLPVLKYAGFGQAVNITLGLPIIRTSVDHGTALDLAGSGNINTGSMDAAIKLAIDLATKNGLSQ